MDTLMSARRARTEAKNIHAVLCSLHFERSASDEDKEQQRLLLLGYENPRIKLNAVEKESREMSNPLRPSRPPPPVPKPGQVKVVRAMYKYEAQQNDELTFDEGDLLYIIDKTDGSWWKAKCGNNIGLIPSNYVEDNTESIDHPMHEAARRGNYDFMKECITNRVSVNGLDKAGSTPLHWAAHGGHTDCLKQLLESPSCQVNVQNKLGDTPLHSAAWKNHPECVKLLLDKAARCDIPNNEKKLPADLTKDAESAAMLKEAMGTRSSRYSEGYGDEEDSD